MPYSISITRRTNLKLGLALLASAALPRISQAQNAFDLRIVQGADVDTLDPAVSRSTPSQIVINNIFNTLVRWKDTKLSELVPDLAESWSKSSDGLKWTFKLREGVKFHDGTPFDSEAVKFNLDRVADPELGSPNRSLFSSISKVTALDPQTVEIETKEPSPTLLEILAEEYSSISSPTAVRKSGRAYSRNPVGTGPYMLSEWIPAQSLTVKRNPDYFGTPGKADRMVFRPVPEAAARLIELQTGNADIAVGIAPEAANELKQGKKSTLLEVASSFQIFFELNTTKPPFNDPRVRLAVNYAIDRKAIIEKILSGYGKVPEGIFPEGVQGRAKQDPYPYDPEKARKIVAEVFPGGFNEKIVMWTCAGRYTKDKEVAETVQSYLNAIGFQTEFKVWEWATYQKTLYRAEEGGTGRGTNAANMWLLGTGVTNADWRLRRKFFSTDGSNLTGYNNAKVDGLLSGAMTDMNYDSRMKAYGDVQTIAWTKEPNSIALFDQVQLIGVGAGIKGVEVFGDEIVKLDQATKGSA
ncbi:ABC transporter substrate-binding protein [Agrobacterium tumefaciens]|uniref:ABC transporter substrate-binding protein n=1 Tax=Agrobacterium tumefaciens TaxID=358 RepID=UPI00224333F1|nr:ABC transporter substrate-binding protein [Agrobacterium tumefaciens]MCW8060083.1 ABC transporter substrate-binding protein [Agrobacterium tumefaciens]MCW8142798.1 ABC transporter substrate-binding protein [Agrobacterium tumefaciens]